ncbi:MAG: amidase [Desulfobacterales bacterium]|nr:amidase [Desulfobacterales bacterium]
MDNIAFRPATELARLIRNRHISSRELLEIFLSRIEKFDPQINAVITRDAEAARRQALRADEMQARGEALGPLHGVPVTIKDGFETAGLRTTSGAPIYKDHIPRQNAVAVQRYVDAGAVIMGKTNVPLFCADSQSFNALFGTTNNPWDLKRTPGGSSGGAAAALAAGLAGLELGSDIAGSIRLPAAWAGVYGHKPSYGIVPFRGHIPPPPGILSEADLSVAGPLGRSAGDLKMALKILAGPEGLQSVGWKLTLPPPRAKRLKDYRVAAWLEDAAIPVDREVADGLNETVAALRRAGVQVDETARPAISTPEAMRTFQQLLFPIIATGFPKEVIEVLKQMTQSPDDGSDLARFARDALQNHREWLGANARRHSHRRIWADFFGKYDILLCPAGSVPAIEHNTTETQMDRRISVNGVSQPYGLLMAWAGIFTYVYLPVTCAPVGRTPGNLPVGIQIVGPYLEDRTTIDFAERLAREIGGFTPPPGF